MGRTEYKQTYLRIIVFLNLSWNLLNDIEEIEVKSKGIILNRCGPGLK